MPPLPYQSVLLSFSRSVSRFPGLLFAPRFPGGIPRLCVLVADIMGRSLRTRVLGNRSIVSVPRLFLASLLSGMPARHMDTLQRRAYISLLAQVAHAIGTGRGHASLRRHTTSSLSSRSLQGAGPADEQDTVINHWLTRHIP